MDRMLNQGKTPELIGARSRNSFNLYRAAAVYCIVENIRESWALPLE